ncbi:hypothetical protein NH340_JMT04797 [Sarcoptes scabiei]|nr:hypothetical protein NH340_JMT04797 [Sarcoptes scabiei]
MIDDDRFVMTLATVINPIIPLTSTVSSLSISTLMQSSSQSESVMKRNNFDFSPTLVPTSTASTIERIKIETIAEISDQSDAYYGNLFDRLNLDYRSVHGYLSLGVCVFGIIANVLNIIVLTRKNMESPTNAILTGMAVSDLLVIASYIPYVIHNYIRTEISPEQMYNYGWAVFTLFHAHNTVLFHTISIWLTVLLAVWRYITVRTRTRTLLTIRRARLFILLVYLIVPIFCIPVFISFTIHQIDLPYQQRNISIYKVDIVQIDNKNQYFLEKITFWVFSVFLKLIPCGLLTCITLALIRILIEARKPSRSSNSQSDSMTMIQSNNEQNRLMQSNLKNSDDVGEQNLNEKFGMNLNRSRFNLIESKMFQLENSTRFKMESHLDHNSSNYATIDDPSRYFLRLLKFCNNCPMYNLFSRKTFSSSNGNQAIECETEDSATTFVMDSLKKPKINFETSKSIQFKSDQTMSLNSGPKQLQYVCDTKLNQKQSPQIGSIVTRSLKTKTLAKMAMKTSLSDKNSVRSSSASDRTTRMLIAILMMFLVCEFPSGILALLSGILGKLFFKNVYNNFGDIMDMLALINSAVNFVLYCLMSQQFRITFSHLFCIDWTRPSGWRFDANTTNVHNIIDQTNIVDDDEQTNLRNELKAIKILKNSNKNSLKQSRKLKSRSDAFLIKENKLNNENIKSVSEGLADNFVSDSLASKLALKSSPSPPSPPSPPPSLQPSNS